MRGLALPDPAGDELLFIKFLEIFMTAPVNISRYIGNTVHIGSRQ